MQCTVVDDNVLTGAVLHCRCGVFEDSTVVGAFDMAVCDPHIFTVIRVDAVTVCHAEIVQDTDAADQYILTADQMGCPEGALSEKQNAVPACNRLICQRYTDKELVQNRHNSEKLLKNDEHYAKIESTRNRKLSSWTRKQVQLNLES